VIRDYQAEVLAADHYTGTGSNHESDSAIALARDRETVDLGLQAQHPTSSPSIPSIRPRLQDSGNLVSMTPRGDPDHESPASVNTSHSYDMIQSAAVQLLDLTRMMDPRPQAQLASQLLPMTPQGAICDLPEIAGISPEQLFADDGIFLPGSAYLELHSALRHHIFDTARSAYPSRLPTPDPGPYHVDDEIVDVNTEQQPHHATLHAAPSEHPQSAQPSDTTPITIELTKQEEFVLWKNWVDEIALWVCRSSSGCFCTLETELIMSVS